MADINFGEPAEVKVPVVDTENKDTEVSQVNKYQLACL